MTVYAITDTKKGRTGIAPTYLHTTPNMRQTRELKAGGGHVMPVLGGRGKVRGASLRGGKMRGTVRGRL